MNNKDHIGTPIVKERYFQQLINRVEMLNSQAINLSDICNGIGNNVLGIPLIDGEDPKVVSDEKVVYDENGSLKQLNVCLDELELSIGMGLKGAQRIQDL